jgi:hypothetical protein
MFIFILFLYKFELTLFENGKLNLGVNVIFQYAFHLNDNVKMCLILRYKCNSKEFIQNISHTSYFITILVFTIYIALFNFYLNNYGLFN